MSEPNGSSIKHCCATRKDGRPCTAPALGTSPFCFAHDPQRAADRDAARKKGGQNRGAAARMRGLVPPRLSSTYDRLESVLERLDSGEIEPKTAQAMASVARALVAVLTAGELEERVRMLEGKANG